VNAAHARGLAVALDVVYNHLGPEGDYLAEYGPYFTDHHHTPWGAALNFDQAYSDEVRFFFIQNALYWLREFHIDALRLDAIHSIFDASALPFLAELSDEVASLSRRLGREIHLIAESNLNDVRVLRSTEDGGFGMHSQWSDDFHHSVHTLLTGESCGYYADFGGTHPLAATLKDGWYYTGQYSKYRKRRHGSSLSKVAPSRLVVCSQNHDQVGNRALGDRLSKLVDFESLKLAAGVTLLSPFLALLFMGEEYGETAPFPYFTSHGDHELGEAVRRGREREFASFAWKECIPDPQSESTFANSKLNHALMEDEPHRTLWRFYQTLLKLRRNWRLAEVRERTIHEYPMESVVVAHWELSETALIIAFHFGESEAHLPFSLPTGTWKKVIDSTDSEWLGKGGISLPKTFESAEVKQIDIRGRSFLVLERLNL
jgi:maltooligosyltrehalose trehalohydrolase